MHFRRTSDEQFQSIRQFHDFFTFLKLSKNQTNQENSKSGGKKKIGVMCD